MVDIRTSSSRTPAPAEGPAVTRRDALRSVVVLVALIAVAELAGLVGTPFTDRRPGGWYDQLEKPPFNPPGWVFGPVWTTLYVLIGVAAWRVWRTPRSSERSAALVWWGVQLVLNAAWTPLFFGAQLMTVALVEIVVLWVAAAITSWRFLRLDRPAAALMAPYLAWVSFALALNTAFVALN